MTMQFGICNVITFEILDLCGKVTSGSMRNAESQRKNFENLFTPNLSTSSHPLFVSLQTFKEGLNLGLLPFSNIKCGRDVPTKDNCVNLPLS
jgi:hypothetical protein